MALVTDDTLSVWTFEQSSTLTRLYSKYVSIRSVRTQISMFIKTSRC